MFIKSIAIKHFRSIIDERVECDQLTAIVGRNGSGKSTILRALELFYDSTATVSAADYYREDTGKEIEIALTFNDLSTDETAQFSAYLDSGTLTVARVFSEEGKRSGKYHGMRMQHDSFSVVRNADGSRDAQAKYKALRDSAPYAKLPTVKKADDIEPALSKWEVDNLDKCIRLRDEGQFFGFANVAQGYLGRHTRFIRVPAVRDASEDATESRGSCVTQIMDLVVRSTLASKPEFAALKERAAKEYREIMDPSNLKELETLEKEMTSTLRNYAPEAGVSLDWMALSELEFPLPKATVRLNEDGYKSPVYQTGHGLQRAFILTMLQHLIAAKRTADAGAGTAKETAESAEAGDSQLPGLVLAIEEPELYQHPSRQRHLATVLHNLASGAIPGVAKRTQVLYSTHSPLFVGLDRFDSIRLLRKVSNGATVPKITKITKADLDSVATEIWEANGKNGPQYTAETLRPRLQGVMTPWVNEGFFADIVVLVEGEDDRAAILGMAKMAGLNFDSAGISVIPCVGKNNLDRPLVIFRHLGIQTFVVWDGDADADKPKPESNRRLLRLLKRQEEDWPDGVWDHCACFKNKLEVTLKDEIGSDDFETCLTEAQTAAGILIRHDAMKNPMVLHRVLENANKRNKTSQTIKTIVDKIWALNPVMADTK